MLEDVLGELRQSERRTRVLAWIAGRTWTVATAGVLACQFGFLLLVWPKMSEILVGPARPDNPAQWRLCQQMLWYAASPLLAGSVVAMLLAALCTLVLVSTARNSATRQIRLAVTGLLSQLEQLRFGR